MKHNFKADELEETKQLTDNMNDENKYNEDMVNNPSHYKMGNLECIDVTQHFNFNCGNAIKYIWRAGKKDRSKLVEDLQKAAWYINKEIERVTAEQNALNK